MWAWGYFIHWKNSHNITSEIETFFVNSSVCVSCRCIVFLLRHGAQANIAAVPRTGFAMEKPHDLAKVGIR